jgi:hypothetical protein
MLCVIVARTPVALVPPLALHHAAVAHGARDATPTEPPQRAPAAPRAPPAALGWAASGGGLRGMAAAAAMAHALSTARLFDAPAFSQAAASDGAAWTLALVGFSESAARAVFAPRANATNGDLNAAPSEVPAAVWPWSTGTRSSASGTLSIGAIVGEWTRARGAPFEKSNAGNTDRARRARR